MSKSWLVCSTLLSICLIGILDYLIIVDLSLYICYLIPIVIATRYTGKKLGIFFAVLSSVFWYIAEASAKADMFYLLLVWNTIVRLSVFLVVVHLLSALNTAYKKEKKLARIDELTKIYNRRYFLNVLQTETKRSIRYERCLTLAYFDVDNFKRVNDRYGHHVGDQLLSLVASTFTKSIRESDIIARLGGDEFALLLPETEYPAGNLVLQRIQQQLIDTVKAKKFDVGFSIGAITFVRFPDSTEKMLELVDRLMYQVKSNGKNQLKHQLYEYQDQELRNLTE
ncbi:MAG: diguanylate cyclase [Pleurocapsa sp. MO_192.B19]|nr:diguanylate cyclase [Pleurocapsa sp. MO_192.B19]